jgi:hypothetical protein
MPCFRQPAEEALTAMQEEPVDEALLAKQDRALVILAAKAEEALETEINEGLVNSQDLAVRSIIGRGLAQTREEGC